MFWTICHPFALLRTASDPFLVILSVSEESPQETLRLRLRVKKKVILSVSEESPPFVIPSLRSGQRFGAFSPSECGMS